VSDTTDITALVTAYDPILAALPSATVYITRAIAMHTKAQWFDGTGYESYIDGLANWALHRIMRGAQSAGGVNPPAGPVQSKRTQDVSITYAISPTASPVTPMDGDYGLTPWGIRYLEIRSTLATGHTQVYG